MNHKVFYKIHPEVLLGTARFARRQKYNLLAHGQREKKFQNILSQKHCTVFQIEDAHFNRVSNLSSTDCTSH